MPDLLLARGPFGASGWPTTVWTNNGMGRFSDSGLRIGSASAVFVEVGDLNRDGNPDLMEIHVQNPMTGSAYTEVWLNNSHFRPFIRAHPATSNPALLLGDTNYLKLDISDRGRLSFQCWRGAVLETRTSTNLTDWTPLVWLTNTTGTLEYLDTGAEQQPLRFYRSVIR